ncbi:hypothetical protein SeMB42_g00012 [Synchytrium endobioticum]|uniref:Large ribosomal subunit protein bL27m n=1 Tax=Synchytrium endobioticum TaxID=286115 RepID=A0A507D9P4_9FUNG|nr:hypothetical protein SeLEV6574_g02065 [Synchytrium endobioticum]TPX54988.1 hypothetical protein SeMB42_g00012 [Synchytrium endobioticum]
MFASFGRISTTSIRIPLPASVGSILNPSAIPSLHLQIRPATKKSSGGTSNGRDSNPKHLGIKKGDGSYVKPSQILVRQRGTRFHPGLNVGVGKDWTLHALAYGRVVIHYDLARRRKIISVDDGSNSLNPVTTRTQSQAKQMLADSIDIPKYMSLDAVGRYKYVLEKESINGSRRSHSTMNYISSHTTN